MSDSRSDRVHALSALRQMCAASIVLGLISLGGANTTVADGCPNSAARVGQAEKLPECRAYEQVSPPFKNGFALALEEVLSDGERVKAISFGTIAGVTAIPDCIENTYDLTRTNSGWVTTAIDDAPLSELAYATHECTPALLSSSGVSLLQLHPTGNSVYERDLYLHEPGGGFVSVGPMLPSSAIAPMPTGAGEQSGMPGTEFVAATPTFSHILFELKALEEAEMARVGVGTELWPGDTTRLGTELEGINSLYEYVGTGNATPSLVGVEGMGRLISDCGTVAGGYGDGQGNRSNVMSEDGSRVFFTAVGVGDPADGRCTGAAKVPPVDELFARVNGAVTVAISEPEALSGSAVNDGCSSVLCEQNTSVTEDFRDANFEKASRDGSRVFFSSTQQLLDGATEDSNLNDSAVVREEAKGCARTFGADGCNLYEYDFNEPEGHRLILVSGGDSSGLGPEVQGVGAVSEDGSHVYFVAKGVLTGEPRGGVGGECLASLSSVELGEEEATREGRCRPKTGEDNLYVRDTLTNETRFVATLSTADSEQWKLDNGGRAMNITDDGRFLVFTSVNQLTAGDSSSVQQVFRYDAATGALVRVSIGDHGSPGGIGASTISTTPYNVTDAVDRDAHPAESEDGSVVVFASSEALAPEAFSNQCIREEHGECFEYSQNIYEYREGQLYVIGHGTGDSRPYISPSGRDIFFESTERLVPQDMDTLTDIYDARVDGGFPVAASPAVCRGEGCQMSVGQPTVSAGEPSSSVFTGPASMLSLPSVGAVPGPKVLTRAQKLAKALKACRAKRGTRVRVRCESNARRVYGRTATKAPAGRHGT